MRTDCSPNLDIKLRPPVQEASKAGNIFITFEIQRMTVGVNWDVITPQSKGFQKTTRNNQFKLYDINDAHIVPML